MEPFKSLVQWSLSMPLVVEKDVSNENIENKMAIGVRSVIETPKLFTKRSLVLESLLLLDPTANKLNLQNLSRTFQNDPLFSNNLQFINLHVMAARSKFHNTRVSIFHTVSLFASAHFPYMHRISLFESSLPARRRGPCGTTIILA